MTTASTDNEIVIKSTDKFKVDNLLYLFGALSTHHSENVGIIAQTNLEEVLFTDFSESELTQFSMQLASSQNSSFDEYWSNEDDDYWSQYLND